LTVNKQLIIQPKVGKSHLAKFIKNLEDEGIKTVFADPKILTKTNLLLNGKELIHWTVNI